MLLKVFAALMLLLFVVHVIVAQEEPKRLKISTENDLSDEETALFQEASSLSEKGDIEGARDSSKCDCRRLWEIKCWTDRSPEVGGFLLLR